MTDESVEIRNNSESRRFEISVAGERVGFATYRDDGGRRVMPHTEIEPAHEGQGLGGELVRAALDATRAEGLLVVPECPFVATFIAEHPEYADLVA